MCYGRQVCAQPRELQEHLNKRAEVIWLTELTGYVDGGLRCYQPQTSGGRQQNVGLEPCGLEFSVAVSREG